MKTTNAFAALLTVMLLQASATALAQDDGTKSDSPPPPPPAGLFGPEEDDPLVVDVPCENISDAATRDACWKALTKRFDYFSAGMDHRTKIFRWQHFSTRVIFVFVLLLVSAGLAFSYMQFRLYLRASGRTRAPAEAPPGRKMDTDIEISTGGVKVSSNVLGVIILALSLAFFYLYLVYVFPISDTF